MSAFLPLNISPFIASISRSSFAAIICNNIHRLKPGTAAEEASGADSKNKIGSSASSSKST